MLRISDLAALAPDVATPLIERFRATHLGLLATIRADGSPRISPIEVMVHDGGLFVGMMPGSTKWRDVVRDPRICLSTPVADSSDVGGDGKIFGVARPIADQDVADDLIRLHAAASGFDPEAILGSPMFEVTVDGAAWQGVEGDTMVTHSWNERDGYRHRRRTGGIDAPVDITS